MEALKYEEVKKCYNNGISEWIDDIQKSIQTIKSKTYNEKWKPYAEEVLKKLEVNLEELYVIRDEIEKTVEENKEEEESNPPNPNNETRVVERESAALEQEVIPIDISKWKKKDMEVMDINNINSIITQIETSINKENDEYIHSNVKTITLAAMYAIGLATGEQIFVLSTNDIEDRIIKDTVSIICCRDGSWTNGLVKLNDESIDIMGLVLTALKNIVMEMYGDGEYLYKINVILSSFEMKRKLMNPKKERTDKKTIFFDSNIPLQVREITEDTMNDIVRSFRPFLRHNNFQFNQNGGLVELWVLTRVGDWSYKIDPGCVMGKGYCILANTPSNRPVWVSVECDDIVQNIIDDPLYILSPEEIQVSQSVFFTNERIYDVIDMTGMSDYCMKISSEEYNKLGKKLSYIINIDKILVDNHLPRLRFSRFKSIDSFELVSDNKCLSPLYGITSNVILSGLSISVNGDNIEVTIGDNKSQYVIENYGTM